MPFFEAEIINKAKVQLGSAAQRAQNRRSGHEADKNMLGEILGDADINLSSDSDSESGSDCCSNEGRAGKGTEIK